MSGSSLDNPLVSVIVPAYNAEKFIAETLDSVMAQTYSNLEVLVVDDGSQDRTGEIVAAYTQKNRRIRLLRQQNAGVAAARNFAIAQSTGEFIAPLDADDIWYPENLEQQVQRLIETNAGLTYAWSLDIDATNQPIGGFRASRISGRVYKTLACHNFIGNASAAVFRRSCVEQVGGYRSDFQQQGAQGCEDWDLYLRIAEYSSFQSVPQFLIGYRKADSTMSRDFCRMAKSHNLMLQQVHQHHQDIPAWLYRLSCSSFYMYLARQSDQCGDPDQTLAWLRAAFKADWLTPPLRYGFYSLFLKSCWYKHCSPSKIPNLSSQLAVPRSGLPIFSPASFSLQFKLLLGQLLHQLLQIS
ncbi:glycosyltransferase family 2 protein [Romeria aff. gracilis LEGE 07310]|uniref:Glycosyltransferase family 2 protein n=1 Tax=Vasconcelosia minhoensis LEGE 07310 TaxID=915328 RepID=A0A8J7AC49_9CYAN|nr:glycosyltransferase family 2 protein [Romeria gracilis]MBE9076934.1 glycosyltransferase family 2 protein [Romeria aff. gracilis LEGE 07310]